MEYWLLKCNYLNLNAFFSCKRILTLPSSISAYWKAKLSLAKLNIHFLLIVHQHYSDEAGSAAKLLHFHLATGQESAFELEIRYQRFVGWLGFRPSCGLFNSIHYVVTVKLFMCKRNYTFKYISLNILYNRIIYVHLICVHRTICPEDSHMWVKQQQVIKGAPRSFREYI